MPASQIVSHDHPKHNLGWIVTFGMLISTICSTISSAEEIVFPPDFKWGVATSAHQIEGDNFYSDHYKWESEKESRVISIRFFDNPSGTAQLQKEQGVIAKSQVTCPIINETQDPDPQREHTLLFPVLQSKSKGSSSYFLCEYSGKAVDHWNRIEEDIALLKQLNIQWYRFSVEWAKIEPKKGEFNLEALNHYKREIRQIITAGIEPHLTLFHFTMPQWLREEGGWESENSPEYFRRFTQKVYEALTQENLYIPVWYTLNEPMVHIAAGYLMGNLPPGKKDPLAIPGVLKNLLQAHALAYRELHKLADSSMHHQNNLRVGVAHHLRVIEPLNDLNTSLVEKKLEQIGTATLNYIWNWMFIDAIETGKFLSNGILVENKLLKGSQDFLGLNYYSRDRLKFSINNPLSPITLIVDPTAIKNSNVNDMGWEIYPKGIYETLKSLDSRVQIYGKRRLPIIISENGVADEKDEKRVQFLKDHLKYLHDAITEGIPVEGYCHWSLLDNFEWNSGYYPQFGLYRVDFLNSMQRVPRKSALFYSELSKTSKFEN